MFLSKNGVYFIEQLDNPMPYGRRIVPRVELVGEKEELAQEVGQCDFEPCKKALADQKIEFEKELYRQDI